MGADDYFKRRKPTDLVCPECLAKGRQSVVMKQPWGDHWRLTCSDFSICNFVTHSISGCSLGDFPGPDTQEGK